MDRSCSPQVGVALSTRLITQSLSDLPSCLQVPYDPDCDTVNMGQTGGGVSGQ